MSPAENESALCGNYSIITDPHERLAAIVAGCTGGGVPAESRCDEHLVPGCVSRVWLTGRVENSLLRLHWQADSPLVQGLAGLVCQVYDGTRPAAAAAFETTVLDRLGLTRQISPTRLHGLASVVRRIRELAGAADEGSQH
jgi:cysteine desulfuration protein SufE